MRRCTVSGLIPLMASERYGSEADRLFAQERPLFQDIIRHESYYLLRELPASIARQLLADQIPALLAAQKKSGMWKVKDTERITYDILAALQQIGALDGGRPEWAPRYCPLGYLEGRFGSYALLIRKRIYHVESEADRQATEALIAEIRGRQNESGSWAETVVGTVVHLERLIELGVSRDDPAIAAGVAFLFAHLHADFQGVHTSMPYGLTAHQVFSSADRHREFEAAATLKPEWLPRHVCFRTMAVIPNSVCLALLVRIGLESDRRVALALDSLYRLYAEHGGLCAGNIKKPYLESHRT